MSLAGQRSRSRPYSWPYRGELPQPLPKDDLSYYVNCLRKGDVTARTLLIEGHLRLAASIVGRYVGRFDINSTETVEELFSEAMYAVAKAVDAAKTNLVDDNITPYIVRTIHQHVSDCLARDRLIGVPPRTFSRHNGQVTPPTVEHATSAGLGDTGGDEYAVSFGGNLAANIDTWLVDNTLPETQPMIDDLINSFAITSTEREIVRLRLKGLSDPKISKILRISTAQLGRIRKEMEKRYESL